MDRPPYRRDAAVLGLAVGVFGMSFGVLAVDAGLDVAKTCAMSLFVFTGASQFAAVGVVESGGSAAVAFGSALLLAARNAVYGVALAPTFRDHSLARRLLAAQFVLDETTAMATAHEDVEHARGAFWATGIAVFVCWNIGTLVGAVAGGTIGDAETYGLDAAFPAGFVALAAPHVRARAGQAAAVLGASVALACIPLAPAGVPVLVAALAVVPAMLFFGEPEAAPDLERTQEGG